MGVAVLAVGATVPADGWPPFWQSSLAGVAPTAFGLAIVVWLIEGPAMTRERRRQTIIAQATRPLIQWVGETSWLMALGMARNLASLWDNEIDPYGEVAKDPERFRQLVLEVFNDAISVPDKGLPPNGGLTLEEYKRYLDGFKDYSRDFRDRIKGDYEVQAVLIEVIEAFNKLDRHYTIGMYPSILRDESEQLRVLGELGASLLSLVLQSKRHIAAHPPLRGCFQVIQMGASRRSMRWVIAMYTQDSVVQAEPRSPCSTAGTGPARPAFFPPPSDGAAPQSYGCPWDAARFPVPNRSERPPSPPIAPGSRRQPRSAPSVEIVPAVY